MIEFNFWNFLQVNVASVSSYSTSINAYIIFYELSRSSLSSVNRMHKRESFINGSGIRNGYHNGMCMISFKTIGVVILRTYAFMLLFTK